MRRKQILLLTVAWLILSMVSAAVDHGIASPRQATLRAVTESRPGAGGELFLRIEGPYSFQTVQATPDTLFVDLKGVTAIRGAKTGQLGGGLLTGYRVLQYHDAEGQRVVRLQVQMRHPAPFKVQEERGGLRLVFHQEGAASTAVVPPQATVTAAVPLKPTPVVASGVPALVSGVSLATGANEGVVIDVAMSRATPFHVSQLENPSRLVVDLEGARNAVRKANHPAASPLLKGVRLGQFRASHPAVVRVVADLVGNPTFDVHASPGGLRIVLKSRHAASVAATPQAGPPPETKQEKPVEVAASSALPAPQGASAVAEGGSKPATVDYQSALPAATGSKEVTAAPRQEPPAYAPEATQAAKAAQVVAATSTAVAAAPQGQAPTAVAPAAQQTPQYTGEPISLNLKDVDLKDFFRLIHEISGLNIIVDPNVTGSVTLVLDAVPWDQALEIVLKNNRLGKTLEGNVLRIARVETLTAEQESAKKLADAREEAQPLVTVFRPVNYAKAATITAMLKGWVGGGALSRRGNILVDDRTNTLIISDIQSQLPVIESIIQKLDRKAKQVSIEARIIRANSDFSRSLATALSGALTNKVGTTTMAGATGTSVVGNTTGTPPLVSTGTAGGFGVYAITNAGNRYIINAAIAAAETKSQAKIISRPTIVTQNNVPGTVLQGTQIPIQTTINNTISIQYVNATLTLTVTPQVTEDGNIFLVINVSNAAPGAVLTSAGPSINTQSATTQVMVPDGGTVVFGGVTVTSRSRSATYVPLIGSIPVIGHLFKTSNVQDSDQELLFFVSPKILPG